MFYIIISFVLYCIVIIFKISVHLVVNSALKSIFNKIYSYFVSTRLPFPDYSFPVGFHKIHNYWAWLHLYYILTWNIETYHLKSKSSLISIDCIHSLTSCALRLHGRGTRLSHLDLCQGLITPWGHKVSELIILKKKFVQKFIIHFQIFLKSKRFY